MNKQEQAIEEIIGDLNLLDKELQSFRKDAQQLSSRRAKLLSKFSKKWVAIYDGNIQAVAPSLTAVLAAIDQKGLPEKQCCGSLR